MSRNRAFSFAELLIVIAIISTLAAMLLPSMEAGLEAARRSTCCNNLKQIGTGLIAYTYDFGGLLPGPSSQHAAIRFNMLYAWYGWPEGTVGLGDALRDGYFGSDYQVLYCPSATGTYSWATASTAVPIIPIHGTNTSRVCSYTYYPRYDPKGNTGGYYDTVAPPLVKQPLNRGIAADYVGGYAWHGYVWNKLYPDGRVRTQECPQVAQYLANTYWWRDIWYNVLNPDK